MYLSLLFSFPPSKDKRNKIKKKERKKETETETETSKRNLSYKVKETLNFDQFSKTLELLFREIVARVII